jgi:hypothetical protein
MKTVAVVIVHDLGQSVRYWLLTAEFWVQSRVTSCEVKGRRNGTGAEFSLNVFGFPQFIITLPLPSRMCDSLGHAAHYHILGP